MALGRRTKGRIAFYGSVVTALTLFVLYVTSMPGRSFRGVPGPLDAREARYEAETRTDVQRLAGTLGQRNTADRKKLQAAADMLATSLHDAGYEVHRHPYVVDSVTCETLDAESGHATSREAVVVGAHYDSALYAPGADDNGSGTAGVLALARAFATKSTKRRVLFALFPNEEPPYFETEQMGSLVYARELAAAGLPVVAMVSLESIGFYSSAPHSQHYPGLVSAFYPDRGDFVAFVGDTGARGLVRDAIRVFREHASIGSEGAALPAAVPGVDWSDHRSFREVGWPAFMVTDTALFRNSAYHTFRDTPETLDYASLGRTLAGVEDVVAYLANR